MIGDHVQFLLGDDLLPVNLSVSRKFGIRDERWRGNCCVDVICTGSLFFCFVLLSLQ